VPAGRRKHQAKSSLSLHYDLCVLLRTSTVTGKILHAISSILTLTRTSALAFPSTVLVRGVGACDTHRWGHRIWRRWWRRRCRWGRCQCCCKGVASSAKACGKAGLRSVESVEVYVLRSLNACALSWCDANRGHFVGKVLLDLCEAHRFRVKGLYKVFAGNCRRVFVGAWGSIVDGHVTIEGVGFICFVL